MNVDIINAGLCRYSKAKTQVKINEERERKKQPDFVINSLAAKRF